MRTTLLSAPTDSTLSNSAATVRRFASYIPPFTNFSIILAVILVEASIPSPLLIAVALATLAKREVSLERGRTGYLSLRCWRVMTRGRGWCGGLKGGDWRWFGGAISRRGRHVKASKRL